MTSAKQPSIREDAAAAHALMFSSGAMATRCWTADVPRWQGLPVEAHRIASAGTLQRCRYLPACDAHLLVHIVGGEAELSLTGEDGRRSQPLRAGTAMLASGDCLLDEVSWEGDVSLTALYIPHAQFERAHVGAAVQLPRHAWIGQDAQIQRLLQCIVDDIQGGCGAGPAYGQALCLALMSYLGGRYGVRPEVAGDGGSTPLHSRQRDLVSREIEHRLGDRLTVAMLGEVVHLGPSQFANRFRATYGESVHRHLMRRRIDKARQLLDGEILPIAEVALSTGFADQSHFTQVFKRQTGVTPAQWRRGLRTARGG